jgi:hypothetical protein
MTNETMRFFFPLKIITYSQYEYSECGLDDPPEEITSAEAVAYKEEILAAIVKENRGFKNDRGLAEYIYTDALKEKVKSLYPSVEVWNGELWGVMTAGVTDTLSEAEISELIKFVVGQNSDGYGEVVEQRPIKTPDGEIYVSFWNSDNYFIKLEQDLKQITPDLGYGGPVMDGI